MKTRIIGFIIVTVALFVTLSYSKNPILRSDNGNGTMIKLTEFENQRISSIQVGCSFEVRIIKTNSQRDNRIELNIPEAINPYLKPTLTNGNLHVTLENRPKRAFAGEDRCFLDIYTNEFSSIKSSGATDFIIVDEFDFTALTLLLSGWTS